MCFDKVKEVIADTMQIDEDEIKLESSLEADLGLDSLDAVEVSLALEEAFETSISQEDLGKLKTVGDIVELIESREA